MPPVQMTTACSTIWSLVDYVCICTYRENPFILISSFIISVVCPPNVCLHPNRKWADRGSRLPTAHQWPNMPRDAIGNMHLRMSPACWDVFPIKIKMTFLSMWTYAMSYFLFIVWDQSLQMFALLCCFICAKILRNLFLKEIFTAFIVLHLAVLYCTIYICNNGSCF